MTKATKGLREGADLVRSYARSGLDFGAAKREALLRGDKGTMGELVGVAVGLMVIIIVIYVMTFTGSELEQATEIASGTHWSNISNVTGDMAESSIGMLRIGIMIAIIFAAIGIFIWPYLQGGQQ